MVEILKFFGTKNISYKNILKLLDLSFALPASNAPIEIVFSISNNNWFFEKSQMGLETLEFIFFLP